MQSMAQEEQEGVEAGGKEGKWQAVGEESAGEQVAKGERRRCEYLNT